MAIVLKRRVSFDFLGEEYKDAYITLQRIPILDLQNLQDKIKSVEENKAPAYILELLKQYFVDGSFPEHPELKAQDLDGLDTESVVNCFQVWTGQAIDPKAESPSIMQSTTEPMTTQ